MRRNNWEVDSLFVVAFVVLGGRNVGADSLLEEVRGGPRGGWKLRVLAPTHVQDDCFISLLIMPSNLLSLSQKCMHCQYRLVEIHF